MNIFVQANSNAVNPNLSSTNPAAPSLLFETTRVDLELNLSISHYYYKVWENLYEEYTTLGFYINTSNSVDVRMDFNIFSIGDDFSSFPLD